MDASRFPITMSGQPQEGSMSVRLLAIDLGKQSFHIHGIDTDGVVVSRKVSRAKLPDVVADLAPEVIAMEACAGAHYWGRRFFAGGHQVRLINPRFVKPFVKGSKNDAIDAEAIYEAATRPTMRFVPLKSLDQQDLQSLHRARERVVGDRTALINHTRGLLAEYGVVLPQGPWRFVAQAPAAVADAELSTLAREIFSDLFDQLGELNGRLQKLDRQLVAICRENDACRRLTKLPGVGPHCDSAGRCGRRRSSLPLGPRARCLDRFGATAVYDWRQASARRHRSARQSLSPSPDNPRRSRGDHPIVKAQRPAF
jgi:transposase